MWKKRIAPFIELFRRKPLRPFSVRIHLVVLVLAAVLPLLVLAGLLFWRDVQLRYDAVERGMRNTARALSLAVDREVGRVLAVAETLAACPDIDAQDFKSFYNLSAMAVETSKGAWVSLFDPTGQMIVNTREPFGMSLPNPLQESNGSPANNQDNLPLGNQAIKTVLQTGRPLFSDLFVGVISKVPLLSVTVPVVRDGKVIYALSLGITTNHLNELLRQQGLPAGWMAMLVDGKGIIAGRTSAPEKFVGLSTSKRLINRLSQSESGWDTGSTQDGVEVYYSFARSNLTDWSIVLGAPRAAIDAPMNYSIAILIGGATLLSLVALAAAFVFGRRISAPISRLAESAEAIQRGEKVDLEKSVVTEVEQLHRALLEANAMARAADAERQQRMVADAKRAEAEKAQEALRESEERFRLMANSAPVMIWVSGTDKRCTWFNKKWLEFVGRPMEQEIGDGWVENLHPEDRNRTIQTYITSFDAREPFSMEYRLRRADGEYRWMLDDGVPRHQAHGEFLGYIGSVFDLTERKKAEEHLKRFAEELETRVAERTDELQAANAALLRDIEERKKLEAQLVQSQKMESIGTLAGGIAHDFNNILNIISGYIFLLTESGGQREQMDESVKVINETVQRGSALVQQLLTLGQKSRGTRYALLNINSLAEGLIKIIRETFQKNIELTFSMDPNVPAIFGDKTQIEQVLLNIFVNARDAMPGGGTLLLKTYSVDGANLQFGPPTAGSYVALEVIDNGIGMDESTRSRIFEPFFSTKETSQRAGLGLSVVYGIIKNHQGYIDVESQPGCGTTFRIYIPAAPAGDVVIEDTGIEEWSCVNEFSARATILVIEDESAVLSVLTKVLSSRGYKILTASDGESAVKIFTESTELIDIVLLDMGLPKMSGKDVLTRIKAMKPSIKIVVASGYFESDLQADIARDYVAAYIQKPYMIDNVIEVLRRVTPHPS
ncbi:MAG TPA: PAS domain S-box protein [Candidatus Binatia bacterium]